MMECIVLVTFIILFFLHLDALSLILHVFSVNLEKKFLDLVDQIQYITPDGFWGNRDFLSGVEIQKINQSLIGIGKGFVMSWCN